ncbi:MAG: kinase [Pseudomonadota bacterium]|nr:kinase [Pseudomonadota bacterium]
MTQRLHPDPSSDSTPAAPNGTPGSTARGYPPDFVEAVLEDALFHGSRVYGIAGLQGTGKSTLAAQVIALARDSGLRAVALSIDDFYLGRRDRLQLGRTVHPLLTTRGPPGSHDMALACETLDNLRDGIPTRLPQFDKISDRRLPKSRWPLAGEVDLVVFEGWFLKTPPQTEEALNEPVNRLEREEDPDGVWRTYCNKALARDYAPLWIRLDRLLWLHGPGFEVVSGWRWQQEETLQALHPTRTTMSRAQVEHFVQFFERVSRQAWKHLPEIADVTRRVDAQRRPY